MLPREIFTERLEKHCKPCSEFQTVCTRGHDLRSPTGCPLRKFEPVQSTGYDEDRGRIVVPVPACPTCGPVLIDKLPVMTWAQVLTHFAASMATWIKAGMPTVSGVEHTRRYERCKSCDHFKGYYCDYCSCLAYAKTKLATEKCPVVRW